MQALRVLYLLAIAAALCYTLNDAIWEAHLWHSGTAILRLPPAPIWNPPPMPEYAEFVATFSHLPAEQPAGSRIVRHLKWDWMLLHFMMWFWGISFAVGLFYALGRGNDHDALLHIVWHLALGLTGSAGVCMVLWILGGGWGPPQPLTFAVFGIVAGVLLAAARMPVRRRIAPPRHFPTTL